MQVNTEVDPPNENWNRMYFILLLCHALVILLFIWFSKSLS